MTLPAFKNVPVELHPDLRLMKPPVETGPSPLPKNWPKIPAANIDVEIVETFAHKFLRVGFKVATVAARWGNVLALALNIPGDTPERPQKNPPIVDQPPQGKELSQWLAEMVEMARLAALIATKQIEISRHRQNGQEHLARQAEQDLVTLQFQVQTNLGENSVGGNRLQIKASADGGNSGTGVGSSASRSRDDDVLPYDLTSKEWRKILFRFKNAGGSQQVLEALIARASQYLNQKDPDDVKPILNRWIDFLMTSKKLPTRQIMSYSPQKDPTGQRAANLLMDLSYDPREDVFGFLRPRERRVLENPIAPGTSAGELLDVISNRIRSKHKGVLSHYSMLLSTPNLKESALMRLENALQGHVSGVVPHHIQDLMRRAVDDPNGLLTLLYWGAKMPGSDMTFGEQREIPARTAQLIADIESVGAVITGDVMSIIMNANDPTDGGEISAALHYAAPGHRLHFLPVDVRNYHPQADLLVTDQNGKTERVEVKSSAHWGDEKFESLFAQIDHAIVQLSSTSRHFPNSSPVIFLRLILEIPTPSIPSSVGHAIKSYLDRVSPRLLARIDVQAVGDGGRGEVFFESFVNPDSIDPFGFLPPADQEKWLNPLSAESPVGLLLRQIAEKRSLSTDPGLIRVIDHYPVMVSPALQDRAVVQLENALSGRIKGVNPNHVQALMRRASDDPESQLSLLYWAAGMPESGASLKKWQQLPEAAIEIISSTAALGAILSGDVLQMVMNPWRSATLARSKIASKIAAILYYAQRSTEIHLPSLQHDQARAIDMVVKDAGGNVSRVEVKNASYQQPDHLAGLLRQLGYGAARLEPFTSQSPNARQVIYLRLSVEGLEPIPPDAVQVAIRVELNKPAFRSIARIDVEVVGNGGEGKSQFESINRSTAIKNSDRSIGFPMGPHRFAVDPWETDAARAIPFSKSAPGFVHRMGDGSTPQVPARDALGFLTSEERLSWENAFAPQTPTGDLLKLIRRQLGPNFTGVLGRYSVLLTNPGLARSALARLQKALHGNVEGVNPSHIQILMQHAVDDPLQKLSLLYWAAEMPMSGVPISRWRGIPSRAVQIMTDVEAAGAMVTGDVMSVVMNAKNYVEDPEFAAIQHYSADGHLIQLLPINVENNSPQADMLVTDSNRQMERVEIKGYGLWGVSGSSRELTKHLWHAVKQLNATGRRHPHSRPVIFLRLVVGTQTPMMPPVVGVVLQYLLHSTSSSELVRFDVKVVAKNGTGDSNFISLDRSDASSHFGEKIGLPLGIQRFAEDPFGTLSRWAGDAWEAEPLRAIQFNKSTPGLIVHRVSDGPKPEDMRQVRDGSSPLDLKKRISHFPMEGRPAQGRLRYGQAAGALRLPFPILYAMQHPGIPSGKPKDYIPIGQVQQLRDGGAGVDITVWRVDENVMFKRSSGVPDSESVIVCFEPNELPGHPKWALSIPLEQIRTLVKNPKKVMTITRQVKGEKYTLLIQAHTGASRGDVDLLTVRPSEDDDIGAIIPWHSQWMTESILDTIIGVEK